MHVELNHTFKCLYEYKIEIQKPNILHFKAFGKINLHYDIRICQKIYNRVTMIVYVKCVVQFNMHKALIYNRENQKRMYRFKNDFSFRDSLSTPTWDLHNQYYHVKWQQ